MQKTLITSLASVTMFLGLGIIALSANLLGVPFPTLGTASAEGSVAQARMVTSSLGIVGNDPEQYLEAYLRLRITPLRTRGSRADSVSVSDVVLVNSAGALVRPGDLEPIIKVNGSEVMDPLAMELSTRRNGNVEISFKYPTANLPPDTYYVRVTASGINGHIYFATNQYRTNTVTITPTVVATTTATTSTAVEL